MKLRMKRAFSIFLTLMLVVSLTPGLTITAWADNELDSVLTAIGDLSNDPREYTADDIERVEHIYASYESLSTEDQATIDDTFNHPSGDGQSYGRILEAAVWAVRSFETDSSTTLADGTYQKDVVSNSSKGKSDSSRTRNWWVESVVVESGQATAYIYVTSGNATATKLTSYPSIWYGGETINRDANNNYALPVDLNGTTYFAGISSSMPRPIMYSLSVTAPIDLSITNKTGMFKAVTASAVMNADGSAALTFALSGTGYHYLYKGTYEQAVANGDETGNWIAGYENSDDKWEFQISIAADELGTEVPVVAISQSYYEKYLNDQNSIDRAFYPRQVNLSLNEATLVTGDYEKSKGITVTNNVSMFKPAKTATLDCVGGPNSNNYKADLVLPMETDSLSNAFVGTPAEAAEAAATIEFDSEAKTFTIPVKWVETFGQPETLVNHADGEPFVISFKSARNGNWYGRTATLDEEAGTLVFDPWTDPAPALSVDEKIRKIRSQVFTDTTWADCEAAKAAWDALSDEEKALVENKDYFGLDTGDASEDDPRNQDGIGENEILVVSFGTSYNDSRVATIGEIEKAVAAAFPDWSVRRAFTSQMVINHIYARDGEKIDNMKQALDRAVANGVKNLVVAPTHLLHGAEYDELVVELEPYKDKMEIQIAEPLLGPVGETSNDVNDDELRVAQAVVSAACADDGYADAAAAAADGAAIVLVCHGTAHSASVTYEQMQTAMAEIGYANVFIGTIEGEPESTARENVIAAVKAAGYTQVILRPLMVTAGGHANKDMADPDNEESWYSQFAADEGFGDDTVTCQIAGLGQIEDIRQICVDHIEAVIPKQATGITITPSPNSNTCEVSEGYWAYFTVDGPGNVDLTNDLTVKLDNTETTPLYFVNMCKYVLVLNDPAAPLSMGTHTLKITYAGDDTYAGSSAAFDFTVQDSRFAINGVCDPTAGGSVTFADAETGGNAITSSLAGKTVYVQPSANTNHIVTDITCKGDTSGDTVDVTLARGLSINGIPGSITGGSFTMPAEPVTVTVKYADTTIEHDISVVCVPSQAGTASPSKDKGKYNEEVLLTASANEGWLFDHFEVVSGADAYIFYPYIYEGYSPPYLRIGTEDVKIKAVFVEDTRPVVNISLDPPVCGVAPTRASSLQNGVADYTNQTPRPEGAVQTNGWNFTTFENGENYLGWSGGFSGDWNSNPTYFAGTFKGGETYTVYGKLTPPESVDLSQGVRVFANGREAAARVNNGKVDFYATVEAVHDWDEAEYTWKADDSSVTGDAKCKQHGTCNGTVTETVKTTYQVTRPATASEEGEGTYTAVFTKNPFTTQTKTVSISKSTGGGTATTAENPVTPQKPAEGGTVATDSKNAKPGATVTVMPQPEEGYEVDTVTVTDKNGKEIPVTKNEDGTYSFTMPASPVSVSASFTPLEPQPEKFVDVPANAWFHDAVYWAVGKGITWGTDKTHFSPQMPCTRGQMVTFLWRAAGEPQPSPWGEGAPTGADEGLPFTDVSPDDYYYEAVCWAVEKGITKGTTATTFSPNATVTRAQTVTFLYRYEQSEGGGFKGSWAFPLDYSDVKDIPEWAYEPFCWMVMHDVVQGSDGKLLPNENCLRCQIVTMLERYFES